MAKSNSTARSSLWRRLKRWLRDYKWPLIGFMWVVAIALGYVGFSKHATALGEARPFLDNLYLSLQLFVVQSGSVSGPIGWELQVARFLAPAMAVYTAVLALAILLHQQLQLFRVRFLKGHIVICGLGRKGLCLCEGFQKIGERVVIIEQDGYNGMLGRCREQGAITLIGSAADPGLLRRAQVPSAKNVISVCGDDGVNAEVAVHARELVWDRKGKALSCLVHIVDLQLCNLLREREIKMGRLDAFRLGFFNVFESGARVLLGEYPPFAEAAEDRGFIPHIVVVGVGRMGETMVVNAARNWRDRANAGDKRLRITLIDREAENRKESLYFRYPQLERVCELVPKQMDVRAAEFERAEFLFDNGHCDVTMVYVCLDDDSCALGAALVLHQRLRDLEVPIVVRMTHDAGLATLLREEDDKHHSLGNLHAFGLLDRTCTPSLIFGCTYEILARAIHEDYVRNEKAKGLSPKENPSMVPWDELPEHLKESDRGQVEHIRIKLEAIGCDVAITTDWDAQLLEFSPEEVELMAEMEHERFVKERLNAGWKPGPTRDLENKTSPALVPWSELPEEEKGKDRDSVRGIPAFLAKARFQVYRSQKE